MLTLLESYYQTSVNTFSKFISNIEGGTPKQYCTLFQTSSNTDIFRELLSTVLHTFPELISSNTDIFRVTGKQYLYQIILTFSVSYWQIIRHTFPEFIPSNIDIFRDFLPN